MNAICWKHWEDKCYLLQINAVKTKQDFSYIKEILEGCEIFCSGYSANKEEYVQTYKIYAETEADLFEWIKQVSFPIIFENSRGRKIEVNYASETKKDKPATKSRKSNKQSK
jgi:hypothetical protein